VGEPWGVWHGSRGRQVREEEEGGGHGSRGKGAMTGAGREEGVGAERGRGWRERKATERSLSRPGGQHEYSRYSLTEEYSRCLLTGGQHEEYSNWNWPHAGRLGASSWLGQGVQPTPLALAIPVAHKDHVGRPSMLGVAANGARATHPPSAEYASVRKVLRAQVPNRET